MPYTYPKSLVAGTPENVADVVTNLNGAAADWDLAFSTYKTVLSRQAVGINPGAVPSAGTFQLGGEDISTTINQVPWWFDPADYSASPRTTKYRVRALIAVNSTLPGVSFTVGFYPVTGSSGAANQIALTLGTVVTGSTAALGTPGLGYTHAQSSDFNAPAAGAYVLGCAVPGGVAANSNCSMSAVLQVRQT